MADSREEDQALTALTALYSSERADGSAIFAVSLQIFAAMLVVAAIAASLLTTKFPEDHPTATLFVPLLAWGLSTYVVLVNALMAARVHSIDGLEQHLIGIANQRYSVSRATGSDGGDRATNLRHQPWLLKLSTLFSYISAFGAVAGVSAYVAWQTAEFTPWWETAVFASSYGLLGLLVLLSFAYIYSGGLVERLENMEST